ncbi:MAG TPA: septation protein SepH [Nocardioides sp.]|uniref:septation protein SepH n=1 Tax=Nocardioides sp. TaxID=35761 RepID=UPI002F42B59B
MVHLRLTGVGEDGRKLLLVSDAGVEFTVDVDDRLRAAAAGQWPEAGGEQARSGQLEKQMESTLRPRDIQARIRSGETPETVAQVAGTSVDKVMPYAAPVLAERAHVAERAQRASIRRRLVEGGAAPSARTLGDAVGSHLRSRNVDPDTVAWDAWRREDGRWTLTGSYATTGRVGAAHFSFDAPGNYVVADDDDAHWLLGEVPDAPAQPSEPARDDLSDARRRRLSAVPADELPLGADAIELVSEDPHPEVAHDRAEETAALGAEAPVEAYLDTPPAREDTAGEAGEAGEAEDAAEHEDEDDARRHEPPARKPVKKTRGRASVPSWDEIMFGSSDGDRA